MSAIIPMLNKLIKSNKGSAVVEFALVLPILMTLFCGFIDFGYIMHQSLVLQNIARDAARCTSLNQITTPYTDLDDMVRGKALNGIPNKTEWDIKISFVNPSPARDVRTAGDAVTVTVKCKTVILTGVLTPFVSGAKEIALPESLTATVVTRVEP